MTCAWTELLRVLPEWMRTDVDRLGRDGLQELRLRLEKPPVMIDAGMWNLPGRTVSADDLNYCVNTASRYSPWASETLVQGYITAPGGHRIGICGQAAMHSGQIQTIRSVTSLCIRVARDLPGISRDLTERKGSILIIGSPGSGKTTLLRDLIRQYSNMGRGSISVVDERGELFPKAAAFDCGEHTDVMTGCGKAEGIDMVLRCMGPGIIAVDEITAEADAEALLRASRCGVDLLATAHASDIPDLRCRPIYRKLLDFGLFQWVVILQRDKSWSVERMVK